MNNLLKHIIRFWVFAFVCLQILYGQNEDRNWVFNINQGLKFLPDGNVSFFNSKLNDSIWDRFSVSCISNKNGDLIFYSGTHDSVPQPSTSYNFLFGKNHKFIKNSFNILSWDGKTLILPADTVGRYYHYFHQTLYGAQQGRPLFYSEIDSWGDSGLGEITNNKNVRMFSNPTVTNYGAVKHANGRDWWIIAHEYGTNRFLIVNAIANGQHLKQSQDIGSKFGNFDNGGWGGGGGGFGIFILNRNGDKLVSLCMDGTIDYFNFDRCTGMLSNFINIKQGSVLGSGNSIMYNACLSPNGRFLYTTGVNPISSYLCYIDQYDLNADDILASRVILYTAPHINVDLYGISLAPNNKIYFTKKNSATIPNSYPGQDYLGVIHEPDIKGTMCNLDLYGLYLNGGKSSFHLPYIPNLHLGPVDGSICDSLGIDAVNTIEESFPENKSIYIYPNPSGLSASKLVINGSQSNYQIFIYESTGKLVWNINSEHNSIELPSNLFPGVYHIEVSGIGGINWIVN